MSWWKKLSGRSGDSSSKPDYYQEGVELLRQQNFQDALTAFRLALRDMPDDTDVLEQLAVTYTRIGMADDAIRSYRRVIELKPHSAGAHYGLAFLLLQRGGRDEAVAHLRTFLARPPRVPDAAEHIEHARVTLAELTGEDEVLADAPRDRT